jgi:hypothetical protein
LLVINIGRHYVIGFGIKVPDPLAVDVVGVFIDGLNYQKIAAFKTHIVIESLAIHARGLRKAVMPVCQKFFLAFIGVSVTRELSVPQVFIVIDQVRAVNRIGSLLRVHAPDTSELAVPQVGVILFLLVNVTQVIHACVDELSRHVHVHKHTATIAFFVFW